MRMRRLIVFVFVLAMAGVAAAHAGPLRPDEAKRFIAGKMFAYNCFDGTRGMGRIYADGSVVGTMQPPGRPARFVAMPTGTIVLTSSSICATLRGALFQPCFDVVQTSQASFRGSVSGLGFAYCDFVRRNPRTELTGPQRTEPLRLRPSTAGSATQAPAAAAPTTPPPATPARQSAPVSAPETLPPASASAKKLPVQSAVVTFE